MIDKAELEGKYSGGGSHDGSAVAQGPDEIKPKVKSIIGLGFPNPAELS